MRPDVIAVPTIRPLRADDIPALTQVLARAYESPQVFDVRLRAYLLQRDVATFVADLGGRPVGMVVGNDYGSIAYVSQMAVDPPLHRHGIGTALMDALIAWADARGFPSIELDATVLGAPLYARYGFRTVGQTSVFLSAISGNCARQDVRPYVAVDFENVCALDARAMGADRTAVFKVLIGSPDTVTLVAPESGSIAGFAVAQRRVEMLGPVIAADSAVAARLFDAARLYVSAVHRVSVTSACPDAHRLLVGRGYRRARDLAHMVRGIDPHASREMLYARINLGQG